MTNDSTRSASDSDDLTTPIDDDEIKQALQGNVAEDKLPVVTARLTTLIRTREQFSGPMPHPDHFEKYERVLPGAAERLMKMAEKDLNHHIDIKNKIVDDQIHGRKHGLNYGGLLFMSLILCAFASVVISNNILAPIPFLGLAAIGGVRIFTGNRGDKQ